MFPIFNEPLPPARPEIAESLYTSCGCVHGRSGSSARPPKLASLAADLRRPLERAAVLAAAHETRRRMDQCRAWASVVAEAARDAVTVKDHDQVDAAFGRPLEPYPHTDGESIYERRGLTDLYDLIEAKRSAYPPTKPAKWYEEAPAPAAPHDAHDAPGRDSDLEAKPLSGTESRKRRLLPVNTSRRQKMRTSASTSPLDTLRPLPALKQTKSEPVSPVLPSLGLERGAELAELAERAQREVRARRGSLAGLAAAVEPRRTRTLRRAPAVKIEVEDRKA